MKWPPWNKVKEEKKVEKQLITPNLPLIEALGNLSPTFRNFQDRAEYSKVFSEVSELYSVIMYSARAYSNMRVKLFETDRSGDILEELQSHEVLEKLAQPNPLTSWTDFLINQYVNKKVQGNSYVLKRNLPGFDNTLESSLWVLPSQYVYAIPSRTNSKSVTNYWSGATKDKFIKGYAFYFSQVDLSGGVNWNYDEIMHTKEPNMRINQTQFFYDLLNGMSPIETLKRNVSNIDKGYEAQNVILKKRGALGILSPQPTKDVTGIASVYTDTEKKKLQKQFENYGLGEEDWQFIISNVAMQYQQMAVPVRELQLFEGIESNTIGICNTYNFPIVLLNYLRGATFSNVNEFKKSLYQDSIIPEAESFIGELNNFLKLPEQGLLLKASYDHVPILQEDAKKEAEKDKITVDTIAVIQNEIFENKITIEQGIAKLKIILGFSEEEAIQLLNSNSNANTSAQSE